LAGKIGILSLFFPSSNNGHFNIHKICKEEKKEENARKFKRSLFSAKKFLGGFSNFWRGNSPKMTGINTG
jgi:hypothetical protein